MVKILSQLCQCHFPEKKNTPNSIVFSIHKAEKYQSAFFFGTEEVTFFKMIKCPRAALWPRLL